MKYPKLTQPAREQTVIDRFLGYEHRPDVRPGAFYDMKNLSGAKEPLLTVRPRRTVALSLIHI